VAASFIGLVRLGIHHVPFCGSSCPTTFRRWGLRGARGEPCSPARDRPRLGLSHAIVKGAHPQPPAAGGAAGTRTPDLRRARAALSQLSYGPLLDAGRPPSVGAPGLEPGTSALSGPRSNQLSYAPLPVLDGSQHRPLAALCRRRSRIAPGLCPPPFSPVPRPTRTSPARERPCRAATVAGHRRPEAWSPACRFIDPGLTVGMFP
jgi:hypothetical protein